MLMNRPEIAHEYSIGISIVGMSIKSIHVS